MKRIFAKVKKFFETISRETKIIVITMVLAFVVNYFRELNGLLCQNQDISVLVTYFDDYGNMSGLILNSGMMTVITSVFLIMLSSMSEGKGLTSTKSVIITFVLLISILWYVTEVRIKPSMLSLCVTLALTIVAILTYIVIVENLNREPINDSDYSISGNPNTYK